MSGALSDKFTDTFNAANPNVAKVTSTRAALGATLACDSLAGWPTTNSKVHFSTYKIDTNNAVVPGTQIDWEGIVSSNSIGSLTRLAGATDTGSAIGDIVEMNPTGSWGHDLFTGLTAEHSTTGTHGAITPTSITNAGNYNQTGGTFTAPSGVIAAAALAGSIPYAKLLSTIFSGQTTSYSNGGTAGGTFKYVNLGGIKILWGLTGGFTISGSSFQQTAGLTLTLPTSFFSTIEYASGDIFNPSASPYLSVIVNSATTTTVTAQVTQSSGTNGSTQVQMLVIGT